MRAVAELAGQPGHPALAVAAGHTKRFEAWLEAVLAADGVAAPATLARQVMIILDGTVTQSLIHRGRETLRARLKEYLRSGRWED